jgi:hypothetical protein
LANPFPLPQVEPTGGAPLDSEVRPLPDPPILLQTPPAFQPQQPDNVLLRLAVADGVTVTSATARLSGVPADTDIADGAVTIDGSNNALIDLGRVRPVSSITFLQRHGGQPSPLMLQIGATWILPQNAGTTNFANLASGVPFPELQASKFLLGNVASVSHVMSHSFPANVTLRINDGGAPFFALPGDLKATPAVVPNFSQPLAQALANTPVQDGRRTADLVCHSDAFGTIIPAQSVFAVAFKIDGLGNGDFAARTQTLGPGAAAQLNLNLPSGLARPASGPIVSAVALRAVALGFGPGFTPPDGDQAAVASSIFELAQPIALPDPVSVASLLLLAMRRGSDLAATVQLRADANGSPAGDVLGTASLATADVTDGGFAWVTAAFSRPVALRGGQQAWVRVHVDQGELLLRGTEVDATIGAARYSTNHGNSWAQHPLTLAFLTGIAEDAQLHPGVRLAAGGQQQTITLPPPGTSLQFGDADALIAGLNAALSAAAPSPGSPLPATLALTIGNEGAYARQITLTRFDMTLNQAA